MNKIKLWFSKFNIFTPRQVQPVDFKQGVDEILVRYEKTLKDLALYDKGERNFKN